MPRGFTDDPQGLRYFLYLDGSSAFQIGRDLGLIGDWAVENNYPIKLCYREEILIDGVLHDFRETPAILMRTPDELFAFRMRWT